MKIEKIVIRRELRIFFCQTPFEILIPLAQLRDAADHLKFSHRETALKLRDLAIVIEENRDAEFGSIAQALDALRIETRELFYADHPDARSRMEALNG